MGVVAVPAEPSFVLVAVSVVSVVVTVFTVRAVCAVFSVPAISTKATWRETRVEQKARTCRTPLGVVSQTERIDLSLGRINGKSIDDRQRH